MSRATLAVQQHLREHGLDDLCRKYAVSARRHGIFPHLVLLKYSQIDSPMAEVVVQQCRGIIVDEAREWEAVAVPYFKFFNHGEPHAAAIDWSTATVYEKLDGSLMCLYHYAEEWRVASSGLPDASGPTPGISRTFADVFWETWKGLGYRLPEEAGHTFMFELCTPFNRVVVPYQERRLVLHGVRCARTFREERPEPYAERYGWECIDHHTLDALERVLEHTSALDPMQSEGVVVCDHRFHRVKIKGTRYVTLAHLKESLTERGLLDLVRLNEEAELLAYFPELRQAYDGQKHRYEAFVRRIEVTYTELSPITDQRAFAAAALPYPYSGALFALRSGKAQSVRHFLADMPLRRLEDWLET